MKSSDLDRVNKLMANLDEGVKHHKKLKNILSGSPYRDSKIPHKVRIEIGGDCHGNGRYKVVTADIQEVEFVVKIISKELSEVWGRIVGIRAKLRELGVDIDDVKS